MNKKLCAILLCGCALVGALATGCTSTQATTSTVTPARTYITTVHQVYSQIDAQMDAVQTACAASDKEAVFTALNAVDKKVKELEAVETPSGLEELQAKYVSATKSLATTVRSYADYRLNGGSSTSDASDKLAQIQKDYAAGIEALKDADKLAQSL